MTESSEWLVVQGDVWHIPQRRDSAVPIRRGTAQRLGIRRPEHVVYLDITPNVEAFTAGIQRIRNSLANMGFSFRASDMEGPGR